MKPNTQDICSQVLEEAMAIVRQEQAGSISEPQGKAVLSAYGIKVPASCVVSLDEPLADIFAQLKAPLAMKVVSHEIIHKSDVGGVVLNLNNVDALMSARTEMAIRLRTQGYEVRHFLIEEMAPKGIEMVVGGFVDSDFGPMVMVGVGGIFIEVYKDVAFGICPIDRLEAIEMINQLCAVAILKGVRGTSPVHIESLVQALLAIGGVDGVMTRHCEHIREIDINPLIVTATGACAVDARFILNKVR